MDEETKQIPSKKLIVGGSFGIHSIQFTITGFSQGGAMASFCGLQYEKPLAGIVSCSGYVLQTLFNKKLVPTPIHEANKETPFLAFHGRNDPMVSIERFELSIAGSDLVC